ncbi:hypothetical protein BKP54_20460 [Ensifer sp. 1H6]|nr:hypothetical protein BKP54_20460 [Ensifer sp. 1H6]
MRDPGARSARDRFEFLDQRGRTRQATLYDRAEIAAKSGCKMAKRALAFREGWWVRLALV